MSACAAGLKPVHTVEGIKSYELDNGLQIVLFADQSKPTATVNTTYLVGSRMENYGETGMAHLLEHLMFKGSKNYPDPTKEFTRRGFRMNGTTWLDRTNYFVSFTANDDNFAALKAILEGSVGGRARNIAVYATSNRRHLIKETLTDRTGDDIHEADTRQELMSLSARFGLTVTFQRPEKARFETILEELARQHHIQMPVDQLLVKAEAFAIRAGGRSPRVAKQFIEQCAAGVQK